MKLKTLSTLAVAICTAPSLVAARKEIWIAETREANSTKLTECVRGMHQILLGDPRAHRRIGYRCGDSWFQFGTEEDNPYGNSKLKVFQMCETELVEATYSAKDWFYCSAHDAWAKRIVAYSPFGHQACTSNHTAPHAPCKVEWTTNN
ncbi:hypothetical protein BST61_g10300 [Cercospora zeina]